MDTDPAKGSRSDRIRIHSTEFYPKSWVFFATENVFLSNLNSVPSRLVFLFHEMSFHG